MRRSDRDKLLDEIYDELPKMDCKGLCQHSCGVIPMSTRESQRIRERGVKVTEHRAALAIVQKTGDFTCEALKDGRCTVYDVRPLICRLWGMVSDVESMRCPHGCEPERWLTREEGFTLIRRALAAGGGQR